MDPEPPPLSYAVPGYLVPQNYLAVRDAGQIKALVILHYVYGGLLLLFSCFALIYVAMGIWFVVAPPTGTAGNPPPPPAIGWLFILLGSLFLLMGWTVGGLTLYSARCMSRRTRWTFSFVMACVLCVTGILGIGLGVFTMIVLLRDSVKLSYVTPSR